MLFIFVSINFSDENNVVIPYNQFHENEGKKIILKLDFMILIKHGHICLKEREQQQMNGCVFITLSRFRKILALSHNMVDLCKKITHAK